MRRSCFLRTSGRNFFKSLIFPLLCFVLLAAPYAAGKEEVGKGPVVITSETLVADNRTGSALFKGSVVARSDDMTMTSDRMKVSYAEGGGVNTIEAEGSVKLVRGEQVIVSERAVYHAGVRKVTFTGSPRALEGANVVTGTRMTYFLDDGRFVVEGSRVFIEQGEGLESIKMDGE